MTTNRKSAPGRALIQENSLEAHASITLPNDYSKSGTPGEGSSSIDEKPLEYSVLIGWGQNGRTLVALEASEPTRFVMTPDSVHNDFVEQGFDQALSLWIWFQQIGQAHYVKAKGKKPARWVCAESLTHAEILERYPRKERSRKWLSDRLKEIEHVTGLLIATHKDDFTGRTSRAYYPGKMTRGRNETYLGLTPGEVVGTSNDKDLGLVTYASTKQTEPKPSTWSQRPVSVSTINGASKVSSVVRSDFVTGVNPPPPQTTSTATLGQRESAKTHPDVSNGVGGMYPNGYTAPALEPLVIEDCESKEVLKDIHKELHQESHHTINPNLLATETQLEFVKGNIAGDEEIWFEVLGISGLDEMTKPQASRILDAGSGKNKELKEQVQALKASRARERQEREQALAQDKYKSQGDREQELEEIRTWGRVLPGSPILRILKGSARQDYLNARKAIASDPELQPVERFARLEELQAVSLASQLQSVAK